MTSLHRDPKLRASDADRDHVSEMLRENAATGRLTMDEFGERLERCYAAQTYGDLDQLVADLPDPDPYTGLPASVGPYAPATGSHGSSAAPASGRLHLSATWGSWVSGSVICWGVWLATVVTGGGVAGLWPVWVTVPWGGVLLAHELSEGAGGRRALPPGPSGPAAPTGPIGQPGRLDVPLPSGRASSREVRREVRREERMRRRLGR